MTLPSHLATQTPGGTGSTNPPTTAKPDSRLQGHATALRMLAARADLLRDRIGELAMVIGQDPVGDPMRQSMLPW